MEDLAAQQIERNYLATAVVDGLAKEGVRFSSLAERLNPFAKSYGSSSGRDLLIAFQDEEASIEAKHDAVERAVGSSSSFKALIEHLMPSLYPQINEQFRSIVAQDLASQPTRRMDELNRSLTEPVRSAMEQIRNQNAQRIKSATSYSFLPLVLPEQFHSMDAALQLVNECLGPALAGEADDQVWNPHIQVWEPTVES